MAPRRLDRHASRLAKYIQLTGKLTFETSEQRQRQRQDVAFRTRGKTKTMNTQRRNDLNTGLPHHGRRTFDFNFRLPFVQI
ncbi:Uncharacterised protein [Klebsiella oxytoca]|nr:Uncharacterised protein [Klebsiella oxytoca]